MRLHFSIFQNFVNICCLTMENNQSEIAQFFANKNILITGGTGFVGKLLIEKLFRSCPQLKGIYLILRQHKDKTPKERLDVFQQNEVFDKVREQDPNFTKRIHIISGDMRYKGLAISPEDRNMIINKVNIVMHCAASVIFTSSLKDAVETNINGTKELLDLCEEIKNLNVAMYMSTAYSHAERYNIGECFMESPIKPETILKLKDEIDDIQFNSLEKSLLKGKTFTYENVYTYTKAISEEIVREKLNKFPIGLYRPSIIFPTYKDPIVNWTDNIYGLFGVITLVALGILHVYHADKKTRLETVPGDYCVNGYIAATYDVYKKNKTVKHPQNVVYNNTSSDNSISIYKLFTEGKKNLWPLEKTIWVLSLISTNCIFYYWILNFFFHFLPALFLDTYRVICFKKPKYLKLYKKMNILIKVLNYFSNNTWNISTENTLKLYRNLNTTDKEVFPFDITTMDWEDFLKNCGYTLKRYVIKDKMDEESLKKSRERYERFETYHKMFLFTIYTVGAFISWKILSCSYYCLRKYVY